MRLHTALTAALAVGACATPAPAAQSAPPDRDCFRARSVSGFEPIDRHHIGIHANGQRQYILTTRWNASDLRWSMSASIRSPSGWVCTGRGNGAEIVAPNTLPGVYPIDTIERAPEQGAPSPDH